MKPILKLYRGYANEQELIVMGHVLKPTNTQDYDFLDKILKMRVQLSACFGLRHMQMPMYI
jgi:hypothetical protein